MVYRKQQNQGHVPGVAPCIAARLASGWQFVSARKGFRHAETGTSFRIQKLPPSTRVELRYPDLADVAREDMSEDEQELSRYVQFVFHPRARLDKHLARIESWAAIESAFVVPAPSLPAAHNPPISLAGERK